MSLSQTEPKKIYMWVDVDIPFIDYLLVWWWATGSDMANFDYAGWWGGWWEVKLWTTELDINSRSVCVQIWAGWGWFVGWLCTVGTKWPWCPSYLGDIEAKWWCYCARTYNWMPSWSWCAWWAWCNWWYASWGWGWAWWNWYPYNCSTKPWRWGDGICWYWIGWPWAMPSNCACRWCWWDNANGRPADNYGWGWGWAASWSYWGWCWCQGVAFICYKMDGSCWFTSATWWDCCYTCNWYCVHKFTTNWTFTAN